MSTMSTPLILDFDDDDLFGDQLIVDEMEPPTVRGAQAEAEHEIAVHSLTSRMVSTVKPHLGQVLLVAGLLGVVAGAYVIAQQFGVGAPRSGIRGWFARLGFRS